MPGFQVKKANKFTLKLIALSQKTYPVAPCKSVESDEVRYYAQRLIDLNKRRQDLVNQMVRIAKSLPNRDLEILESIPGIAQTTAVRICGIIFIDMRETLFLTAISQYNRSTCNFR